MAPGKRKATRSLGPRPPAPAAPEPPRFVACPTCGKSFVAAFIQDHAWKCGETMSNPPSDDHVPKTNPLLSRVSSRACDNVKDNRELFVECPTCQKSFPPHIIESHAWECLQPLPESHQIEPVEVEPKTLPRTPSSVKANVRHKEIPPSIESHPQEIVGDYSSLSSAIDPSDGKEDSWHRAASISNAARFRGRYHVRVPGDGARRQTGLPSRRTDSEERGSGSGATRDDAVKRLMEGGKRAMEIEREAKTVPRSWPVELVEEILPPDYAASLLACLLEVSRDWTTQPWYNNNGVEGRSHSRSHIFRFRAGTSVPPHATADDDAAVKDLSTVAERCTPSHILGRPQQALQDGAVSRSLRPGSWEGRGFSEGNDGILQSSEDDEFDYYGLQASPEGCGTVGPNQSRRPSGQQDGHAFLMSESRSGKAVEPSAAISSEPGSTCTSSINRDRRSTFEEIMLSDESDEAPAELRRIVPLIVDVVRRRQRRRVEEGLGGTEGLQWTPNFCICHVYDDHRSHIGAHSDTLSNIGPQAIVAGISLGAKRVFAVQETLPWGVKASSVGDGPGQAKKCLDMTHNSAVIMWSGCQERYKHSVPALPKGVGIHPIAGTKRISITLRERKETLPPYLLPIPDCRCGVAAVLKARVLPSGEIEYLYQCDRGQGQCGFLLSKALASDSKA